MSARQALGLDIYEARALAKALASEKNTNPAHIANTPASLFSMFIKSCDRLWPIDRNIIEEDVNNAQRAKGTKEAIERCRDNRLKTAECRLVTLEQIKDKISTCGIRETRS